MLAYFYGPDTFGAREEIGRIAKEKNLSIRFADREDVEKESLATIVDQATSGLFGGSLVVVRDAAAFPKALQEQVVSLLKANSSQLDLLVIWDREKPDKRTEYFKALKKHGREFPLMSIVDLAKWLASFADIEQSAAQELVLRVGADRWSLKNEVTRLALAHARITKDIVVQEVPARDTNEEIFAALDALSSGNGARAIALIEAQIRTGESELYVLSMLAYQFKTLLAIRMNKVAGLHPFVVQKNQAAARRFSVTALQEILTRIMATDFAIKQGKADARTALMMLVVALAQTKTPARSRG